MTDDLIKFADDINDAIKAFPKETNKFMKAEGRKLRKQMRARARRTVKRKTGNYIRGFQVGRKVYKWTDAEYNLRVYNSSPHAHLLEYGHRMLTHAGKMVGYVTGYHIIEHSGKAFEDEYLDDINNNLVDFILEELEK